MALVRLVVLAPRRCPGSIVLCLVHEVLAAAPNRCPSASSAGWALPAASYGSCPRERPTSLPGVSAKSRQSHRICFRPASRGQHNQRTPVGQPVPCRQLGPRRTEPREIPYCAWRGPRLAWMARLRQSSPLWKRTKNSLLRRIQIYWMDFVNNSGYRRLRTRRDRVVLSSQCDDLQAAP